MTSDTKWKDHVSRSSFNPPHHWDTVLLLNWFFFSYHTHRRNNSYSNIPQQSVHPIGNTNSPTKRQTYLYSWHELFSYFTSVQNITSLITPIGDASAPVCKRTRLLDNRRYSTRLGKVTGSRLQDSQPFCPLSCEFSF